MCSVRVVLLLQGELLCLMMVERVQAWSHCSSPDQVSSTLAAQLCLLHLTAIMSSTTTTTTSKLLVRGSINIDGKSSFIS